MNITQRDRDLGTAYAMKPSTTRTELTQVGRGTPMGELLRRYWHPVGLVADATDTPRKLRIFDGCFKGDFQAKHTVVKRLRFFFIRDDQVEMV